MTFPNNINPRRFISLVLGKLNALCSNSIPTPEPASPLIHPALPYAREFGQVLSGQKTPFPWLLLAVSLLGIIGSATTDIMGFLVIFPYSRGAAILMGCTLECFVAGTITQLSHTNRRASKWILAQAVLFGVTSVVFSVSGMNYGATLSQARINAPVIALEAAQLGAKNEAEAATQTEIASLARIQNELAYIDRHSQKAGSLDNPESGYATDMVARRNSLLYLQQQWRGFDFSSNLAAARTPDQIWSALRGNYARLAGLSAETSKITAQTLSKAPPIPLPPYPTAPVAGADAVQSGINDVTGTASLLHPTPKTWLFLLVALVLDLGPYLVAASFNARNPLTFQGCNTDQGEDAKACDNEDDAGDEDAYADMENPEDDFNVDWDRQQRRMRRVGDDLRIDALGTACDGAIRALVEMHQTVEGGRLMNLSLMRSLEIFEEEMLIRRDAAQRLGITPAALQADIERSYKRLLQHLQDEQQILDGAHTLRIQGLKDAQTLRAMASKLALVKQIAEMQAQIDALSTSR